MAAGSDITLVTNPTSNLAGQAAAVEQPVAPIVVTTTDSAAALPCEAQCVPANPGRKRERASDLPVGDCKPESADEDKPADADLTALALAASLPTTIPPPPFEAKPSEPLVPSSPSVAAAARTSGRLDAIPADAQISVFAAPLPPSTVDVSPSGAAPTEAGIPVGSSPADVEAPVSSTSAESAVMSALNAQGASASNDIPVALSGAPRIDPSSSTSTAPIDVAMDALPADPTPRNTQRLDAAKLAQRISALSGDAQDLAASVTRLAAAPAHRPEDAARGGVSTPATSGAAAGMVGSPMPASTAPAAGLEPAASSEAAAAAAPVPVAPEQGLAPAPPNGALSAQLASNAAAAARPVPSLTSNGNSAAPDTPSAAAVAAFTRAMARASAPDAVPASPTSAASRADHVPSLPVTSIAALGMNDATHAAAAVDPPTGSATLSTVDDQALGQQIVQGIRLQWQGGVGQATIQLQPEHLGSVTVSLKVEGQSVSADIQAETSTAQHWISTHETELRSGLERHGLTLQRFVVSHDESQQQRRFAEQQPRRRQEQPRPARRPTGPLPTFQIAA
jgi:flagellar hook-length control protein FliK